MTEEFDDTRLLAAFASYRDEARTALPAQDIAGVHRLARHRRTVRTAVAATAAAVAIAVPAIGYAVGGDHQRRPAPPAPPGPLVTPPADPSPGPTTSRQGTTSPPTSVRAPDGRISRDALTAAGVDLPAWDPSGSACPTRGVTFRADQSVAFTAFIVELAYSDVDGDGAVETTAIVGCRIGQAAVLQAVGFDRDRSGSIVTLGQVVSMSDTPGAVRTLFGLRAGADGRIGVQVGDAYPCCGIMPANVEHQWRWYAYDGRRFRQTGGPTAFTPVPKEYGSLKLTMTPVVLGPAEDGVRHAMITITVHNDGPGTAPGVRLALALALADTAQPPPDVTVTAQTKGCGTEDRQLVCHYPALAAGASGDYRFTVTWPVAMDPKVETPGVGVTGYGNVEQPGIRMLDNPDGSTASATGPVTMAG
jgi:hypothetical protein